jgi:hypothetical protein
VRFAIKTSPQNTTWAEMLAIFKAAYDIDVFESGWVFDHFYPIFSDSTGRASKDGSVSRLWPKQASGSGSVCW